jgi:hypothetical protein
MKKTIKLIGEFLFVVSIFALFWVANVIYYGL